MVPAVKEDEEFQGVLGNISWKLGLWKLALLQKDWKR